MLECMVALLLWWLWLWLLTLPHRGRAFLFLEIVGNHHEALKGSNSQYGK